MITTGGAGGTMRALVATTGAADSLGLRSVPRPVPGPGDLLVAVHAAAVTPGELDWPDAWPAVPAHDVSGVVVGWGDDVTGRAAGEEVLGLIAFDRPGGAAELVCIAADDVTGKPPALDHVAAAALPLGALTAWQALFEHAHLEAGQSVLVHGGAGGVGSYAIALAARAGAAVTTTVSARDLERVRRLGATRAVDYTTRFEDAIDRVDVVVDTVGGDVTGRSWALVRPGGTLVGIAEEPDKERAEAHGVRSAYFTVEPNRTQLSEIVRLAAAGELDPAVGRVLDLEDASRAFERAQDEPVASGRTVIRVGTTPNT